MFFQWIYKFYFIDLPLDLATPVGNVETQTSVSIVSQSYSHSQKNKVGTDEGKFVS